MNDVALPNPSDEKLNDIFSRLLDLYERQTQERQFQIKDKEEFAKTVHMLITQTKEFGQYEMGIRKRIQDCIKESAQSVSKSIEESVMKQNQQSIEKLVQDVSKICSESISAIKATKAKKSDSLWLMISAAIIGSIFSSLLVIYLLMPEPMIPLTSEEISTLHKGQMLEAAWPKLNKKEKDHIYAISIE